MVDKESIGAVKCKHEMDPDTERYDHKLGRKGYCKKCGHKIYTTQLYKDLKRERPKMKKKKRRKLNKMIKENK